MDYTNKQTNHSFLKNALLLLCLFLGLSFTVSAQEIDSIQSNVSTQDGSENQSIPFNQVTTAPEFPNSPHFNSQEEAQQYFTFQIRKFVGSHFNTENVLPYLDSTTTRVSIQVRFTIDEKGKVRNVKAISPNLQAKEEAIRVIHLLPLMIPAKSRGRNVSILYELPISFQIQ